MYVVDKVIDILVVRRIYGKENMHYAFFGGSRGWEGFPGGIWRFWSSRFLEETVDPSTHHPQAEESAWGPVPHPNEHKSLVGDSGSLRYKDDPSHWFARDLPLHPKFILRLEGVIDGKWGRPGNEIHFRCRCRAEEMRGSAGFVGEFRPAGI